MKNWGLSDEAAKNYVEERHPTAPLFFFVLAENWASIEFFRRVERQWIIGPMGGFMGLNYLAIDVIVHRLKLDVTPQMFDDLMTIEMYVLPELNRSKSHEQ